MTVRTTDAARLRAAETVLWRSLGVEPVERRIRLPRLGTDVRVQDIGSGRPVLFLHGGSTWGTSWADLAARLDGVRCLLVDRPGTGLSEPLPRPVGGLAALGSLADGLVVDMLDALGLDAADLVATSFGGFFAFRAALAHPTRVQRIVEFGWSAGAPVPRLPALMRLGTAPIAGDVLARLPATAASVRGIFRGIGHGASLDAGRISPEAIDAYAALLRCTPSQRNDLDLGRLFLSPLQGVKPGILFSPEERARIETPVRFIWGDADPFGGVAVARAFASAFAAADLQVVHAGHAPWMDDAVLAARLTTEFLMTGGARAGWPSRQRSP